MTAPSTPTPETAADRLEGLYGLDAHTLKLSEAQFARKVGLWLGLAAERETATPAQQAAHVEVLALRSWQTALMREADKFRAEGDITVEKDIMSRVAQVQKWLTAAEAAAGLTAAVVTGGGNPAPEFAEWGLRHG